MYDRDLAIEIVTQIYESTQTILKRFYPVKSVEDFTGSDGGMERIRLGGKSTIDSYSGSLSVFQPAASLNQNPYPVHPVWIET